MEDYNKVLDATEVAENANGVAAEKMTVYNESLAAAQNRLTASIQQFAQDSNLDQILALAYDGLSKVVEILNILLNKIPILSPMIKALGVALAAAFGAKMLGNAATLVNTITGITTAASGALSILSTTAFTIGSFAVPIWGVVAAVTAIGVALKGVYDIVQNNKPEAKLEKANQELEDSNKTLEDTQSKIKDVSDKITEIRNKGTLTLADKQELQELEDQRDVLEQILQYQKDINAEKQKEVKTQTGEQMSGKYTSGAIDSDTAYQWKTQTSGGVASSYAASSGATAKLYNTESASVSELVANLRILDEERKTLMNTEGDNAQQLQENTKQRQENITALKAQAVSIGEDITKMKELGLTNEDYYKNAVSEYNQIQAIINPANFEKVQLSDLIDTKGVNEKLQEAIEAGDEAGQETAEKYARRFADQILRDDTAKDAWAKAMSVDVDDLNIDNLTQEILSRFQQMYSDIGQSASAVMTSNGVLKSTEELLDELGQQEVDLATKTKSLSDAYNAMTKNGKITSAQMKALVKDFPEVANAIEVENGAIKVNIELLQDLYKETVLTNEERLQNDINTTNAIIENTSRRITALQKEMEAMEEVLVGTHYVQTTLDEDTGLLTAETSKSVESTQSQLDSQIERLNNATANLKVLQAELDSLRGQHLEYTGSSTGGSTSQKGKEEKEFEDNVKNKMKNLGSIVKLYAKQTNWFDDSVIADFKGRYKKVLKDILGDPKSRKIVAESLGLDISEMSAEKAIDSITKLLEEQYGTIDEKQQELTKKYIENKEKEVKAIKDAEKAEKERYDNAIKAIEELEDLTTDMIEQSVDLIDKAGSFVFDILGKISDRYDKQTDNLDKISDKLDEQKDAFEDKIDKQKELLKLQKQEADNADELADKNKAIADIDAQLLELQYDNSAEAQAKRLKLLDERAEKEKDLADWQKDNDYNAKIDALDKEKSEYEKTIEVEKKALEAQKKTIEDSQKSFENTLKTIQNGFNGIIKILNSTPVKNILTKALISYGGEDFKNALYSYNRIFGDGNDETVKNLFENFEKTTSEYGFKPGQWIGDLKNWLTGKSNTQQNIIDTLDQTSDAMSTLKDQLEAGAIDAKEAFGKVVDVNKLKETLSNAKNVYGDFTSFVEKNADAIGQNMKDVGQNVARLSKNLFTKIGDLANKTLLEVSGSSDGVLAQLVKVAQKAVGTVGSAITQIATKLGITSAGGAGVTAAAGTAGAGTAGTAAVATGGAGALGTLAIGGSVALGGYALIKRYKEYAKVWSDKDKSLGEKLSGTASALWEYGLNPINIIKNAGKDIAGLFGKHHSGADYVKKQNPELDRMLGLGDDETVSILKVGEAVVPTWANNASVNSNSNSYTGSSFGNAIDSAVKSARASSKSSYSSGDSSISISMPINIQGDADASTVKALQKESNNIVNKVLKTINNQTKIGGYKNIKAATV